MQLLQSLIVVIFVFFIQGSSVAKVPENTPRMPDYDRAGRVLTLNNMGWMHPKIDAITAQFIEFCSKKNGAKVLEIVASYRYASEAALKQGADVWINDLDNRHLLIFRDKIKGQELLSRVNLVPGDFPEDVKLENNSFDAILAVRVLHFFLQINLREQL